MSKNPERDGFSQPIHTDGVPYLITTDGQVLIYRGFATSADHQRFLKGQDILRMRAAEDQLHQEAEEDARIDSFAQLVDAQAALLLSFHEKMWNVVEEFMRMLDLSLDVEFSTSVDPSDRVMQDAQDAIFGALDSEEELQLNCITLNGSVLRFTFVEINEVSFVKVSLHTSLSKPGKELFSLSELDFNDDIPDSEMLEAMLVTALQSEDFDPVSFVHQFREDEDEARFDHDLWTFWQNPKDASPDESSQE